MASTTRYALAYRRKREGRTNYRKRLHLLQSGTPRLVIRRTNKHYVLQLVSYVPKGDKVELTIHTKFLPKLGWKHGTLTLPAGYLAGFAFGKQAIAKGRKKVILDLGFQPSIKGSRIYAVVKGAVDAGLDIAVDETMFPAEERLKGAHLDAYAAQQNRPATLSKDFEQALKAIQTSPN